MIEKNWEKFTTFYFAKNAPATNNPPLENYYSTSLKTHRKETAQNRQRNTKPHEALNNEKNRTTGQTQKNTVKNIPKVHTLPKSRIKKAHPTKNPK